MNWTALWVVAGGVALAVGVNLYFFSPRRAVVAAPPAPTPPAASEPAPTPIPPAATEAPFALPAATEPAPVPASPEAAEPPTSLTPEAASPDDAAP
jgi:hypothetical protein